MLIVSGGVATKRSKSGNSRFTRVLKGPPMPVSDAWRIPVLLIPSRNERGVWSCYYSRVKLHSNHSHDDSCEVGHRLVAWIILETIAILPM